MFTGIIEATADVVVKSGSGITIARPAVFDELHQGQSISVNGACLSITGFSDESVSFDVVPETFARTNLGTCKKVNLERAMKADSRFEGHMVTGHVDSRVTLQDRQPEGEGERFVFEILPNTEPFLVEKGSVCLNGVSLTIASCEQGCFSVALIPHTLRCTNLALLRTGETVNLETDYFAKLLYKWHFHAS